MGDFNILILYDLALVSQYNSVGNLEEFKIFKRSYP